MIRMSRHADYGIVLLASFTHRRRREGAGAGAGPGEATDVVTARDLAYETHLPAPMVMKILKALARHGLLQSVRGAHGGYRLHRAPEEITVAEIITALDGPIGMTECAGTDHSDCSIAALCALRSNWQTINGVVRGALQQVTLAQMAGPRLARAPLPIGAPR